MTESNDDDVHTVVAMLLVAFMVSLLLVGRCEAFSAPRHVE